MKIHVVADHEQMSLVAAKMFFDVIKSKPDCVLGLATGETPIRTYELMVREYESGRLDMSRVRAVNLDEYYPISPDNPQSYRYFMNKHLFDRVNIDKKNTYLPDGTVKNTDTFCREYEYLIDSLGGIDMQILGIGRNGHIGFNEPASELMPYTHLTALTENTIKANARFFEKESDVPKHALTMGIRTIFKAKNIVLLASGEQKAQAVKEMLSGAISTSCPASVLCLHPSCTLICDSAAYSLV